MANLQTASSTEEVPDEFPAGLRVLVVDHDITVLKATEQMSARYRYRVTTCSTALAALEILLERKDCFDVILVEMNMPDMDGNEFIRHLHCEMINIPVITMSVSEEPSDVFKALQHGACRYLTKPLRDEEFRIIWQHVITEARNKNKKHESSMSLGEDDSIKRRRNDGFEFALSEADDAAQEAVKAPQQSSSSQEINVVDSGDGYPPPAKKQRLVWTPELHREFVKAVDQLGVDKAVPKRILESMNVPFLTRENIASHLQKFRQHLKKNTEQQNEMPNSVPGTTEGAPVIFDFSALAAAAAGINISNETQLAGVHPELIGQLMPQDDQTALLKPCIQWPNQLSHAEHAMAYGGHHLPKYPSNIPINSPQLSDASLGGYGTWPSSDTFDSVGVGRFISQLNQQRFEYQQKEHQLQQQSHMLDQIHPINVQPSTLQEENNNLASVNQNNGGFVRNSLTPDYTSLPPQSNNSPIIAPLSVENANARGIRSFPTLSPLSDTQVPDGSTSGDSLYEASLNNL